MFCSEACLWRSGLTSASTGLDVEPAQALGRQAEKRVVEVQQASFPSFFAATHSVSGSSLFFAANAGQAPESRTGTPADPVRPGNSTPSRVQPAFRDASGLNDHAFDQLLRDDLGGLSSSPPSHGIVGRGAASTEGSDHAAPLSSGAGAAVGGPAPSLDQGGARNAPVVSAQRPECGVNRGWRSRVFPRNNRDGGSPRSQSDHRRPFCPCHSERGRIAGGRDFSLDEQREWRRPAGNHHAVDLTFHVALGYPADFDGKRQLCLRLFGRGLRGDGELHGARYLFTQRR
jgi:hypothetical protein